MYIYIYIGPMGMNLDAGAHPGPMGALKSPRAAPPAHHSFVVVGWCGAPTGGRCPVFSATALQDPGLQLLRHPALFFLFPPPPPPSPPLPLSPSPFCGVRYVSRLSSLLWAPLRLSEWRRTGLCFGCFSHIVAPDSFPACPHYSGFLGTSLSGGGLGFVLGSALCVGRRLHLRFGPWTRLGPLWARAFLALQR